MPTGYTAYIEDGNITTAADFLMLCARAFGACVEMRDEPLSTPVPQELQPDEYYSAAVDHALEELEKAKRITIDEAREYCEANYRQELERRRKYREKQLELRSRYEKVLEGVKEWVPPSAEHIKLQEFAIEQIDMCMPDPDYYVGMPAPEKETPETWLANKIKDCEKWLNNRLQDKIQHEKVISERNAWLKALRESL